MQQENDEFYLQDSRQTVGNDLLWWCVDGAGYTTDLSRAWVISKEKAMSFNRSRETDIPWPKAYIDERTRPAVDCQNVSLKEALKGHGLKLKKPKKRKQTSGKTRGNCPECGKITWDYNPYENAYCSGCRR
jgi:hypothetical protein